MNNTRQLSKNFYDNMQSNRMKAAKTIDEITNAMSPFSKANENAFWEYLYGRADRAIKNGIELNVIDNIALLRRESERDNITDSQNILTMNPVISANPQITTDDHIAIPNNVAVVHTAEDAKKYKIPGFYVYMISYPSNELVKIGKHSGYLSVLRTRYNTTTNTDFIIHAFACVDNTLFEKSIHLLLQSNYHHRLEFFKDTPQTRETFFTVAKLATIL